MAEPSKPGSTTAPIALLLLVLCSFLGACASTSKPQPSGHLVIVGGGLEETNAPIRTRFVELCAQGPIGIVPTASGDGIEAGERAAMPWVNFAKGRPVIVIELTKDDAAKANDPGMAHTIESCGGLWFTGGDQSRIINVFRPNGQDTLAMQAVRKVLDKGGVVGGTSAGAAMMSDPMITGGRSRSGKSTDPENEDDRRVRTSHGLGLFTYGLTDQHFLQRGRAGRLIDALHDTGIKMGFGVSEDCAMVVHQSSGEFEAIGDRAVCIIDSRPSQDPGTVRLSVLSTGDRADSRSGVVTPRVGSRDRRIAGGVDTKRETVENIWSERTFVNALKALCITRSAERTLVSGNSSLTLQSDDMTRVLMTEGDPMWPCMVDVLLRVGPPTLPSKPE